MYRRMQSEGLQQQYMDPNDDSIRKAAHSMCALAIVPPEEVPEIFDKLYDEVSDSFISITNYFEATYIRKVRARGRRRAVPVRYAPTV